MKPFIRDARLQDVFELAETMCEADRLEIRLTTGLEPKVELLTAFRSGETRTVEFDDKVIAMFGVTGEAGQPGVPWMLSTADTRKVTSLAREARAIVQQMAAKHRFLSNVVWSGNIAHLLWIDWLGFNFVSTEMRDGQQFIRFDFLAPDAS